MLVYLVLAAAVPVRRQRHRHGARHRRRARRPRLPQRSAGRRLRIARRDRRCCGCCRSRTAFAATAAMALVAATLAFGSACDGTSRWPWRAWRALALLPFVWPEALAGAAAVALQGAQSGADRTRRAGRRRASRAARAARRRREPERSLPVGAGAEPDKRPGDPPEQLAVFTDGSGMTAITRFDGDLDRLRYLDEQTAALPYHLRARPRVLVLGAGGGADVLLARLFRAPSIDAVELDPRMVELVRSRVRRLRRRSLRRAAGARPRGGRAQLCQTPANSSTTSCRSPCSIRSRPPLAACTGWEKVPSTRWKPCARCSTGWRRTACWRSPAGSACRPATR